MSPEQRILCPRCGPAAELVSVASIALRPDDFWDEMQLYLFRCGACGTPSALLHLRSDHGALDGDGSSAQEGFVLEGPRWQSLRETIASCAESQDESCRCAAHAALRREAVPSTWGRFSEGVVERFAVVWAPRRR